MPHLPPIPDFLRRLKSELSADFTPNRPLRISRAPGRLDVMGGIADYTGSLVLEYPLHCAAAVALQDRDDRQLQVFSFNLLDDHLPFTLRIPLDSLAQANAEDLRREFNEPGRKWAAYLVGTLFLLHEQGLIDLRGTPGMNLALLSTVPIGAGVSSSAAIEVAAMINFIDHLRIRPKLDPLRVASLCQQVENRIVGAPCGIMDQVASTLAEPGLLLRMLCQPHDLEPPLALPAGLHVLGINSAVKHSVAGEAYAQTRCAAFMAHRIILEHMRHIGRATGRELRADPMQGYLANLDPEDYKRIFRSRLPESISGSDFLQRFGSTIDPVTAVRPDRQYAVQRAADHHVLEARRVRDFARFLEEAHHAPRGTRDQGILLDKAGHLMYASHRSYTDDALLGAPECDLLVDLCRKHEPAGIYGAKITAGGAGGTVALLADDSPKVHSALEQILDAYRAQTNKSPSLLSNTSPGAWHLGTTTITLDR